MSSSKEESLWLVGSEANAHYQPHRRDLQSHSNQQPNHRNSQHRQHPHHPQHRGGVGNPRPSGHLYTEEMQVQPAPVSSVPSAAATANPGPAASSPAGVRAANNAAAAAAAAAAANSNSAENNLIDNAADATLLAQFHEDAIKQAGVGSFQAIAALYLGLCLAADTIEFFSVFYILPSAEVELCIEDSEKGWLSNITLLGLALGGVFWGGLGDRLGRRRSLLTAMSVHALFSGVTTFMPTYGTFMSTKLISSIGIGGALPLAFVYLAECCPRINRGKWIGLLVGAGALGGVYAALVAWAVVPTTGEMVVLENKEHFSAWHRFLMFCCVPAFCATVGLIFLPESPRYLIEAGRDVEAMMILQRIYKKNNSQKNAADTQYQLSELELPNQRPRGLTPSSSDNHNTSVLAGIKNSIDRFLKSFREIFSTSHIRVTIVLIFIWSAAAFGLYGFMTWCPEYLKFLRGEEFKSHTKVIVGKDYKNETFTGSIENRQYKNSSFKNCLFSKLIFSHVDFDNCSFQSVEFNLIKSSKMHFTDSKIFNSKFIDTDFSEQVFIRCERANNTELSLSGPCPTLDLDYNIYIEEVMNSHLAAHLMFVLMAGLAGVALTVLHRPKTIGVSLFLSSIVALCLLTVNTSSAAVLGFEAGFIAIFAIAWTSLILLTVEYYPTHLRCTGFGIMAASIRISGILGTIIYQMLVSAPLIVPALMTAAMLITASIATLKLPQTHGVFL